VCVVWSRNANANFLAIERQVLCAEVCVEDATESSDEESTCELFPPALGEERVFVDRSSCQGLDPQGVGVLALEGSHAIDSQTQSENEHKTSARETTRNFRDITSCVSQRPELDERSGDEEAVCQTDLNASKSGRDSRSVRWEVTQEVCHDRSRGDWSFEHANERVSVDRLHDLVPILQGHARDLPCACCPPSSHGQWASFGIQAKTPRDSLRLHADVHPTLFYSSLV